MPKATANGIEIEYESFGHEDAETILLIMGLGAQMTRWKPELCRKLAAKGYRVIRFDNRDVGLSTWMHGQVAPSLQEISEDLKAGRQPKVPYTLFDMANDAAGLLDALAIDKAHIVGASLGGMVAQLFAAEHPERTLSLTSIMSNSGNPQVARATPEALAVLSNRPPDPREDEEGFLAASVASTRVIGSSAYPADEAQLRADALAAFKRAYNPAGFLRQYAAANASGDRRASLNKIVAPTLVLHGADDPLVPLAGGRDTAENIAGAELRVIPGMGHDLPQQLYDTFVDAIDANCRRARQVPFSARLERAQRSAAARRSRP
jgi:pimeloyl-ACP methyl ester carboxylesterase